MRLSVFILIVVLSLIFTSLYCLESIPVRGGLTFSFASPTLVYVNNQAYFSVDIQVSAIEENQKLGTGIVIIDYNNAAFGDYLHQNQNLIATPGSMLYSGSFPSHGIIVNDNRTNRLALTFEYVLGVGNGSLITNIPQQLVNLKLKIQSYNECAGLSFNSQMMSGQQFLDDNNTIFNPVICSDEENSLIPAQPLNANLSVVNGSLNLTWQHSAGCSYTVYSSGDPNSNNWQIEAQGLTQPVWICNDQDSFRFYRVTACGIQDAK